MQNTDHGDGPVTHVEQTTHGEEPINEVVVTGFGAICSIGADAESLWRAIQVGKQGSRPIRSFDASQLRNRFGCEIDEDLLETASEGRPDWRHLPRATRLAAVACAEALDRAKIAPEEVGALLAGTTTGDLLEIQERLIIKDPAQDDVDKVSSLINANFAHRIAQAVSIEAPAATVATSCSAGNIAVCQASDLIRKGQASRVVAGGSDALSKFAFIGFSRMRGMAPEICTPFAAKRRGMLLGEGAAFLVLESLEAAQERDARIYARIRGYGLSCDAYHVATPEPHGRGAAAAMQSALKNSGLAPEEVSYLSAHGTGTRHNDLAESRAYRRIFGDHRPPISSLKALVGHCLGGASALEAVASILSLRDQLVIPAWHVEEQDPACDVYLPLPDTAEAPPEINVILSNALAFGGNNSCLALERYNSH